uniref:Acetylcholine receptor subunit beta-like 1 isoform X1 n=1 Tax=Diabrotica virgifera virgifera TaxID=50390 RepID=A0A6P7F121_DIAVI
MQIIDVDEKNQLLITNIWLKLEWNDMNLRWNSSEFGGVKDLRIPPHRLWKPDVLMYNSADEGFDGTYPTNVVVRNNGSCLYVPPGIFKSTCKIDITWFPFDDQRCEMKFGSWTYDGLQLDLQLQDDDGGDLSSFITNGEWDLLGVPGKRNEIYYKCCPEPYIDITFFILIRRRTLYYFFNLIVPCVLIASMAVLGFTLPPDSGEKLSLGVTILLSLTVFLNMVAETMPATSDAVPLLGTYFNCIMFMVASSVVSTILILNYHHRNADTHEMSQWIRVVFLCWLPWVLRMQRPADKNSYVSSPNRSAPPERKPIHFPEVELKERSSKSLLANVLDIDDDFRHNYRGGGTPTPLQPTTFFRTVYSSASVRETSSMMQFRILRKRNLFASIGSCSEDEERLVRDLFRGYNKLIRPVQNMTEKVDVRFGLAFVQLINVNEKNQIMKSNVWLRLVWNDYQLQWDEADYGGIAVLRLPPDKVWKPDIVLFNNADGNYEVRYKSNVLIYPNGEVLWVPPAIYQSSCTIDVTYFPFDQQTCIMKFGSWTFNGDQVSLALYNNKNFVDLSDYWKSGTWDIIEVPAYLNIYEGNHPTETDITFYIIIRRKTLFYTVNLILPTVLISFLCVLVFYLPAEAGEKVTLGISILLSLVVFLLLVSKILPPTSLVLPLIAKYLLFTFIMNTVSILVTVVIINWNFRGPRTHRMPSWIRSVFLNYLPAMLLMKRPRKTRLRWMMEMPGMGVPPHPYGSPTDIPKNISSIESQSKVEVMELSDLHHHPNCKINRKPNAADLGVGVGGDSCRRESESSDSILLSPEASKATEAVEFIAEHLRNEDLYIQTREDWKYVAMVIDRLQLYMFFIVTTAGTVGILMDAPHIFEYVDQDRIIEIYRGK